MQALVVEGGAMRGIFAAGVLDYFLEQDYNPFDFAVGVSAGATNLIGYLAGDLGRNHKVITTYATRPEFIRPRALLSKTDHICNVAWLWFTSFEEVPLSFDRYLERRIPLHVVSTRIENGEPYYTVINEQNLHQAFPASCAIPIVFREFPELDGKAMTDGGVSDSIPVRYAYEQGARDITVVLSRPLGYRMRQSRTPWLANWLLQQHPALCAAVHSRHQRYNDALDFIANPPTDCKVRVIAPDTSFKVGRFTRDVRKLDTGFKHGASKAQAYLAEIWL